MKHNSNIPEFIGVGAMRCGTTWLADKLRSHPDIYVPSHYKELQFFDEYYAKGFEWYVNNFALKGENQIAGEFTPNYLRHDQAIKLIHQNMPDAKLIISLRNPIDRAYSHYNFLKNRKHITDSFYEALFDDRFEILKAGLYGEQLKNCLKYFSIKNIHIVIFDDIQNTPRQVVSKLYEFLGVRKDFVPDMLSDKINERHDVRSKILSFGLRKIKHSIRPFVKIRHRLIKLGVYRIGRKLHRLNSRTTPADQIEKEAVDYLTQFYSEDLQLLNNLLNGKISHWLA